MAKQTNLRLQLSTDEFIFYKRLGGYFIRRRPKTIRRSGKMVAVASLFGDGNRLEKAIRLAVLPLLPFSPTKPMMRALAAVLYSWLRTGAQNNPEPQAVLPPITGFNWNEAAPLAERFTPTITLQRLAGSGLALQLPAFNPVQDIMAPTGTEQVKATIQVLTCDIATKSVTAIDTHEIIIPYTNTVMAAQTIETNITTAAGTMVLAVMALRYYAGEVMSSCEVSEAAWLPVGIVGGMYN